MAMLRIPRCSKLRKKLEVVALGALMVFTIHALITVQRDRYDFPNNDNVDITHKTRRDFPSIDGQGNTPSKGSNVSEADFHTSRLPLCPSSADRLSLRGPVTVNFTMPTWRDLEGQNPGLDRGGQWTPKDCIPRHNVAIIVPYRDRPVQLMLFLQHIHPFLQRQKIAYRIYILEQIQGKVFNRGLSRNIGFIEALKLSADHECMMFHDVDLLPLDARNMYTCPEQPRHVCTGVNYINNFKPLYQDSFAEFGHVTSFRLEHYRLVNGYSNLYLGWGAEDDDIHARVRAKGLKVLRYPDLVSRYYGIPHQDESTLPRAFSLAQNVSRFKLLDLAERRIQTDGLSSSKYTIHNISFEKLFTKITFDVEEDLYAKEAIHVQELYDDLYGELSEYWKNLKFIPPPFWWKNETLANAVRHQFGHRWIEELKNFKNKASLNSFLDKHLWPLFKT